MMSKRTAPGSKEKTAAKTAAAAERVPQPHGGALLRAGQPGNAGGAGRPSSALRERLRGSFGERVAILESIADDPEIEPRDRVRAVDILGKYGVGQVRELSVDDVRERLRATITIIQAALSPHQVSEVLVKLREVWIQ